MSQSTEAKSLVRLLIAITVPLITLFSGFRRSSLDHQAETKRAQFVKTGEAGDASTKTV